MVQNKFGNFAWAIHSASETPQGIRADPSGAAQLCAACGRLLRRLRGAQSRRRRGDLGQTGGRRRARGSRESFDSCGAILASICLRIGVFPFWFYREFLSPLEVLFLFPGDLSKWRLRSIC